MLMVEARGPMLKLNPTLEVLYSCWWSTLEVLYSSLMMTLLDFFSIASSRVDLRSTIFSTLLRQLSLRTSRASLASVFSTRSTSSYRRVMSRSCPSQQLSQLHRQDVRVCKKYPLPLTSMSWSISASISASIKQLWWFFHVSAVILCERSDFMWAQHTAIGA